MRRLFRKAEVLHLSKNDEEYEKKSTYAFIILYDLACTGYSLK
jgi:hypothetical protein